MEASKSHLAKKPALLLDSLKTCCTWTCQLLERRSKRISSKRDCIWGLIEEHLEIRFTTTMESVSKMTFSKARSLATLIPWRRARNSATSVEQTPRFYNRSPWCAGIIHDEIKNYEYTFNKWGRGEVHNIYTRVSVYRLNTHIFI